MRTKPGYIVRPCMKGVVAMVKEASLQPTAHPRGRAASCLASPGWLHPPDSTPVQAWPILPISPLINGQKSRSVALGFPASTLSLPRMSGSPSIPLSPDSGLQPPVACTDFAGLMPLSKEQHGCGRLCLLKAGAASRWPPSPTPPHQMPEQMNLLQSCMDPSLGKRGKPPSHSQEIPGRLW